MDLRISFLFGASSNPSKIKIVLFGSLISFSDFFNVVKSIPSGKSFMLRLL